jgi:hypothetical protein
MLALPVFFSIVALVTDGSTLMAQRRSAQNAADAAALAAAQELAKAAAEVNACAGDPVCLAAVRAAYSPTVLQMLNDYLEKNGFPDDLVECSQPGDADYDPKQTNCYSWPYSGDYGRVEVRVKKDVNTFFTDAVNLGTSFTVKARSVAATSPVVHTTTTTIPGTTNPGTVINGTTYPGTTDPGTTLYGTTTYENTYTDTTFSEGDGGVGFAISTSCVFDTGGSAITYSGAGGGSIGALETNGGFTGSGNANKTIVRLSLGRNGEKKGNKKCYDNSGAVTILNPPVLGPFAPKSWPTPPPPVPSPPGGCTDLGSASITLSAGWETTHSPGIYCLTGTTAILTLSAINLTGGAGYTFFAPNISVGGGTYKCYLFCGGTPGTAATLFFATVGDVKSQGNEPNLIGNIYAPNGEISFTGGGVTGGKGFLEAQTLKLAGNFASYLGTGGGGGTASTSTTTVSTTVTTSTTIPGITDPGSTTPDQTIPGETVPGSTSTNSTTVGSTIGLGE